MNFLKKLTLIVFIYFIASACIEEAVEPVVRSYQYEIPNNVNDGLETSSLSEVGIDTEPLNQLMNNLQGRGHNYHAILIVKDGKLVFEEYFTGRQFDIRNENNLNGVEINYSNINFDLNELHFVASVTKSFTSSLIGIALDKGLITSVDQKLNAFFPEYSDLFISGKENITLENMLTMTSGLAWDDDSYPIYDRRNDEYELITNNDPLKFVLNLPITASPGSNFQYNSGSTVLLGEVVSRTSGMSLQDFANQYLFKPMGINNFIWANCFYKDDISFASGGLYLRPRDMAKFGLLYLNNGKWNNEQIISERWIEESLAMSIQFSNSENDYFNGYGYQWWQNLKSIESTESYLAAGWGGQFIIVLPEFNSVVVLCGGIYEDPDYLEYLTIFNNFIFTSLN